MRGILLVLIIVFGIGMMAGSIMLVRGNSWVNGTNYVQPNSSWSENVNISGNLSVQGYLRNAGIPVCLSDGTNCPASAGDNASWNQSLANTLYAPISIISDNTSWNESRYWSNASASFTTFSYIWDNYPTFSYTQSYVASVGNWTADRGAYYNTSQGVLDNTSWSQIHANSLYYPLSSNPSNYLTSYTETDPVWTTMKTSLPNLTYAQIASNIGNWSADRGAYYNTTQGVLDNRSWNQTLANSLYLGISSTASNSNQLAGQVGSYYLNTTGGFTNLTVNDLRYVRNASIPTCTGSDKLTSAGNGVFTCAADQTGAGGGGLLDVNSQNNSLVIAENSTHANLTINLSYLQANCAAITGSADLCDGSDATGAASTSWTNWTSAEYATTNNATYTVMNNLTVLLAANSQYLVSCDFLTYSAAATTGEQLRVNTTGTPTTVNWAFNSQVSATTRTSLQGTSTSTNAFLDTGSAGTNVRDITSLRGYIVTGASTSNLTYEVKSEISASNAAYAIGSRCEYNKIV